MDLFLVLYMTLVFMLGYFLMSRLDRFMESPEFLVDIKGTYSNKKSYILVFGYTKIAIQLIDLLMTQKLDFIVIDSEEQLDKSMIYTHLFAISDSDYSNLIMSLVAKKSLGVEQIIAICNGIENRPIYDQNKIQVFQTNENAAEQLYLTFFPAVNQVTIYDK